MTILFVPSGVKALKLRAYRHTLVYRGGNRDMGRVNRTASRVVTEYHAVAYGAEVTLCGLSIEGMSMAPGAASKCEACYRMVQADLNAISLKQQFN